VIARERVVGVVLLLLGAGSLVETLRIKDDWTGARLLPLVAGVALLVLGAAHVIARPPVAIGTAERPAIGRVALVLALLALYVAVFPALGFLVTTVALLLALIRGLGGYRWPAAVGLALGLGLACHVVFRTWLGMPLPDGLLGY
jgi:putative tricarboxylic transport membrane protein